MDSHYVVEVNMDIAEKKRICTMCRNKECTEDMKSEFKRQYTKRYCENFQYPRSNKNLHGDILGY